MNKGIHEQISDYHKYTEASGPHSKLGKFYQRQVQKLEQDLAYYGQFKSYGEFQPKTVTELEWSQQLEILPAIHDALKDGATIHVFQSGGGLRVVGVSKGKNEIGYGESPFLEDALVLADRDLLAGGKPYKEVYGKEYPHFYTGSSKPSSNLDEWILRGNTLDISQSGDVVLVELHGYQETKFPQELVDQVIATGESTTWVSDRGFSYFLETFTFPSGETGVSGHLLTDRASQERDPWFYNVAKRGIGKTIDEAATAALRASPVEVS